MEWALWSLAHEVGVCEERYERFLKDLPGLQEPHWFEEAHNIHLILGKTCWDLDYFMGRFPKEGTAVQPALEIIKGWRREVGALLLRGLREHSAGRASAC